MIFKSKAGGTFDVGKDTNGDDVFTGTPDEVRHKIILEKRERIVGSIHGHDSSPGGEYFSGYDVNHTGRGQRSYLITATGEVLRYTRDTNEITVIKAVPKVPDSTQFHTKPDLVF